MGLRQGRARLVAVAAMARHTHERERERRGRLEHGRANILFGTIDALLDTVDKESVGNEERANLLLLPPLWSALQAHRLLGREDGAFGSLKPSGRRAASPAGTRPCITVSSLISNVEPPHFALRPPSTLVAAARQRGGGRPPGHSRRRARQRPASPPSGFLAATPTSPVECSTAMNGKGLRERGRRISRAH
ncbi:hypothetical protein PVAP13_6NG102012 [Panicum virgatum]|uniref:Uncharacterized protein n=1 Tax=Panicum virgatum TaxID=38727 RepID=A0A8T0QWU9_PANVG|nr:hypothetical protein PVAP13_6NG102012 [Panicum virgatum]